MDLNKLRNLKIQQIQSELEQKILGTITKQVSKAAGVLEKTLADLSDQMQPGRPKEALNFALDVARPYLQSLGLRVSKITKQEIEVVLPARFLTQDSQAHIDEGAVVAASIFAFKRLWKKNFAKNTLDIRIVGFDFESIREAKGVLRLRMRLESIQKEQVYAQLSLHKVARFDGSVQVFDGEDQKVADLVIQSQMKSTASIGWK